MSVKPIPDGYRSVTPYLVVDGAVAALDYYSKALGAVEILRLSDPSGKKIMHAEIRIGDSVVMLADEMPEMGFRGPRSLGGSPVGLMIYVEDVDASFARAVDAGGKTVKPVADQFYGDRNGTLEDPFGHVWTLSTHREDLSPEELQRRFEESMQQHGG